MKKVIKKELEQLILKGTRISYVAALKKKDEKFDDETTKMLEEAAEEIGDFKEQYDVWYTQAYRCVRTFVPERLEEFERYFLGAKNAKDLNYLSAGITHYLQGLVSTRGTSSQDYFGKFWTGLEQQIGILKGVEESIDSVIFNFESEAYFKIYNAELDAAKELRKNKQIRAAGAIAGVVIEDHLKSVCKTLEIKFKKKNLSISDYNEELKKQKTIDTVTWRLVTRCGDIRNLCVHAKERDPTTDEVDDIIRAAEKIISEVA